MARDSIQVLCERLATAFPPKKYEYVPPTPEQIEAAERALGASFPRDYLDYLRFGSTIKTPFTVLQIAPNGATMFPQHDVVDSTLVQRNRASKPLPSNYIIIRKLGERGDYHAFDTSKTSGVDPHDYAIVRLEYTRTGLLVEPLFANFRGWLEDEVSKIGGPRVG